MMDPAQDPLDLEELAAIYRVERKSPSLSAVRRDLYPAMAGLMSSLKTEYSNRLSDDPDSLLCEGASQNRRRCETLSKDIVELRMGKIASIALRNSMGGRNPLDLLTSEEKLYHDQVSEISRSHYDLAFRMAGNKRYRIPPIDAEPAREADVLLEEPMDEARVPAADTVPTEDPIEETADLSDARGGTAGEMTIVADPPAANPPSHAVAAAEDDDDDDDGRKETGVRDDAARESDSVTLRILEDLPEFSGADRTYRLYREDVVTIPRTLADALVRREKAVLLKPSG